EFGLVQELSKVPQNIKDSIWQFYKSDTLENESLSTHPATTKRKEKINMLNEQFGRNHTKNNFLYSEKEFNDISNIAKHELVRLNLIHNRFFPALYYALLNIKDSSTFKKYNEIGVVKSIIGILK